MSTKNTAAKKDYSLLIKIVAIVVALIVIGLSVFNLVNGKGVVLRSKTAVKSDNFKVSGTEMAYFTGVGFQQFYQQYSSVISYLGLDPSVSLKEQDCAMTDGGTWFDYFSDMGKTTVREILALNEYAKANGIVAGDDEKKIVEDNVNFLKEAAAEYGYPTDAYINALFRNGLNEKDVRGALALSALATKASQVFGEGVDVSLEKMEAYYAEHPEEFDGVDYYTYTLDLSAEQAEAEEAEEAENAENAEEAEDVTAVDGAASLAFIAGLTSVNSIDSYKALVAAYEAAIAPDADADAIMDKVDSTLRTHVLKSSVADEKTAEWLFSAKPGEVYLPEEETGVYTIVVLAKEAYRQDNLNRAVRHILIAADDESEDDEALAQQILDELKAADFSEEKWNELAAANSTDSGSNANGGLYEDIVEGQTYAEFNAWLFDENRAEGDYEIVDTDAGHHVMYYVGQSDNAAWMSTAETSIKNSEYSAMIEQYGASITFNDSVLNGIVIN